MKAYKVLLSAGVFLIFSTLGFYSCNDQTDDPPTPPISEKYAKYFVSGSYGDIVNYEVDLTNKKYRFYNETTNYKDSGSFRKSTNPNLLGIYEFDYKGSTYFGFETPDKLFATAAPSGNNQNALCFGLNAQKDLSQPQNLAALSGKYLWVLYQDINDLQWGGFELLSNGTFTWQIGPDDDNNFDETKHFAGGGGGTWRVLPENTSRLEFTENGDKTYGTILDGKVMIIDNGPGKGFTAGIKYPSTPVTQASLAGTYNWLDLTPEGYRGVGYFNLPATGSDVDYFYKYYNNPYANEGRDTMFNFRRSTKINNAFIGEDTWDGDHFYTAFLVLPGESFLFYTWGENAGMVSYGIAAKKNE